MSDKSNFKQADKRLLKATLSKHTRNINSLRSCQIGLLDLYFPLNVHHMLCRVENKVPELFLC